jgi:hypothetical protein
MADEASTLAAAQAAAAVVAATPAPTPAPTPTTTPQTVTIPLEQLQALTSLQARIATLENEKAQRETAVNEERVRLLTAKGEAENAVKALREQKDAELSTERGRLAQTEERAKRYALDGELSRALASANLVSAAAVHQLAGLFRSEFQVHAEGEGFVVRTPTFQSVGQFIAEKLASPDYAHFVRAGTTGGSGGAGSQAAPTQPAQTPPPAAPANLGEAVILHMQGMQKAQGDPQQAMALPFGLKRAR